MHVEVNGRAHELEWLTFRFYNTSCVPVLSHCHITLWDQYDDFQFVDEESRGQEGYLPKVTLQIRVLVRKVSRCRRHVACTFYMARR